jgi:hypothetical protein
MLKMKLGSGDIVMEHDHVIAYGIRIMTTDLMGLPPKISDEACMHME